MLFVLSLLYAVMTEKHHRIFRLKKIKWKMVKWYSSVAVHLSADQEVPSSTLGAPYLMYTKM